MRAEQNSRRDEWAIFKHEEKKRAMTIADGMSRDEVEAAMNLMRVAVARSEYVAQLLALALAILDDDADAEFFHLNAIECSPTWAKLSA